MLRNEHHSSRMQIALLISNMGVDGALLDEYDLNVSVKSRPGYFVGSADHTYPALERRQTE
jgi:hypothetical protein